MDCEGCLELLEEGEIPECMAAVEGQEVCPVAEVDLWAANQDAWEAYGWIKDVTLPAENRLSAAGNGISFRVITDPGLRPPPLDLPGVINVLAWLGLDPGSKGDREGLMNKLLIIHKARQEANQQARQPQANE